MILGIETVTRVGSLAVVDKGEVIAQTIIDTKLNHTAGLISVLDGLLTSINVDISEMDAVAVDVGPGSFTGIRVGIASAKGLIQLGNIRLVGVCSLEVLSYEVLKKGLLEGKIECLVPFIDAKRGGIYTAWYQVEEGKVQIVKEPHLTTIKKLLGELPPYSYIFGPDINLVRNFYNYLNSANVTKGERELYLRLLEKKVSNGVKMIKEKEKPVFPSAGTLAGLAGEKMNERIEEKSVEPMYIYDVEYST